MCALGLLRGLTAPGRAVSAIRADLTTGRGLKVVLLLTAGSTGDLTQILQAPLNFCDAHPPPPPLPCGSASVLRQSKFWACALSTPCHVCLGVLILSVSSLNLSGVALFGAGAVCAAGIGARAGLGLGQIKSPRCGDPGLLAAVCDGYSH